MGGVALLILGLVLFIGLVVAHEFGHFIFARRNGVEAEEFGIGFPPRIWGRKTKKGLEVSINWLPLGGFVRLKGEHDADTEQGTFGAASVWAKTKIMAAGVGMNLVIALVLFTILAWVGIPQLIGNQFTVKSDTRIIKNEVLVGDVESGSPAARIGLQPRDELLSIGLPGRVATNVASAGGFPNVTKRFAGQAVVLTYERASRIYSRVVTLTSTQVVLASQKTAHPKAYLGVAPVSYTLQRSTWSVYLSGFTFLPELEKAGVQTWRYQDGFLHEKAILVDDYCGIGTANFDNRSFRLNFEITLLFAERSTVEAVEAMFAADFARSTRASATDFTDRSWWFRFAARTSRLMAPIQ